MTPERQSPKDDVVEEDLLSSARIESGKRRMNKKHNTASLADEIVEHKAVTNRLRL